MDSEKREKAFLEHIEHLKDIIAEVYCCTNCSYIDKICACDGFWEKGEDGDGEEIFACNGCGKWVRVRPATLEDLKKTWERKKIQNK